MVNYTNLRCIVINKPTILYPKEGQNDYNDYFYSDQFKIGPTLGDKIFHEYTDWEVYDVNTNVKIDAVYKSRYLYNWYCDKLEPNKTYQVRVRYRYKQYASPWSDKVTFSTPTIVIPPPFEPPETTNPNLPDEEDKNGINTPSVTINILKNDQKKYYIHLKSSPFSYIDLTNPLIHNKTVWVVYEGNNNVIFEEVVEQNSTGDNPRLYEIIIDGLDLKENITYSVEVYYVDTLGNESGKGKANTSFTKIKEWVRLSDPPYDIWSWKLVNSNSYYKNKLYFIDTKSLKPLEIKTYDNSGITGLETMYRLDIISYDINTDTWTIENHIPFNINNAKFLVPIMSSSGYNPPIPYIKSWEIKSLYELNNIFHCLNNRIFREYIDIPGGFYDEYFPYCDISNELRKYPYYDGLYKAFSLRDIKISKPYIMPYTYCNSVIKDNKLVIILGYLVVVSYSQALFPIPPKPLNLVKFVYDLDTKTFIEENVNISDNSLVESDNHLTKDYDPFDVLEEAKQYDVTGDTGNNEVIKTNLTHSIYYSKPGYSYIDRISIKINNDQYKNFISVPYLMWVDKNNDIMLEVKKYMFNYFVDGFRNENTDDIIPYVNPCNYNINTNNVAVNETYKKTYYDSLRDHYSYNNPGNKFTNTSGFGYNYLYYETKYTNYSCKLDVGNKLLVKNEELSYYNYLSIKPVSIFYYYSGKDTSKYFYYNLTFYMDGVGVILDSVYGKKYTNIGYDWKNNTNSSAISIKKEILDIIEKYRDPNPLEYSLYNNDYITRINGNDVLYREGGGYLDDNTTDYSLNVYSNGYKIQEVKLSNTNNNHVLVYGDFHLKRFPYFIVSEETLQPFVCFGDVFLTYKEVD